MIFLLNVLLWLIIHLLGAYIPSKFNAAFINKFTLLDAVNQWEIITYEKLKVKRWKEKLPDGGDWTKGGIKKKNINIRSKEGIERFLLETKRAELSHWLQILPAPIFFTFNDPLSGIIMIIYAFSFNIPFIIIQRYNRYRLIRCLSRPGYCRNSFDKSRGVTGTQSNIKEIT
ncbi:glycosyl-4,4'-diaponeurosporenoate acyltransferase [Metabacillus litoralis]|uniref:Glycosyl-4,4'-diaponeurosporenoate acyltransferase n=1 Tax=Metabacillus litoralis TaxID=152268 RepID=A0A5C6VKY6_9BACI|nr:glycosyl-4,4'-diaponeurosporenoate acyltransferase [Metabacillus litoralis]TXC85649.1 glycosyl-4,4'-diaponeurosporenoate acyltransferase [Metabacillus litoralis]